MMRQNEMIYRGADKNALKMILKCMGKIDEANVRTNLGKIYIGSEWEEEEDPSVQEILQLSSFLGWQVVKIREDLTNYSVKDLYKRNLVQTA